MNRDVTREIVTGMLWLAFTLILWSVAMIKDVTPIHGFFSMIGMAVVGLLPMAIIVCHGEEKEEK